MDRRPPHENEERKRADSLQLAKSKRVERALRASEERYRSLFEDSRDTIFISTPGGRLIDINRAGVQLFGYESREELLRLENLAALYWDPQDRERLKAELATRGFVEDYELVLKTNDGRRIRVEETGTVLRNADGEIIAYRGILRDVTAQRDLENKLHQAQKMEALGQLAGGISHDFNNLLTAILGYVDLALSELPDGALRLSYLEEIKKAGEKGAKLIRQLLAFSRQQVLQTTILDLNSVVSDIQLLLRRTIGENIDLHTELTSALWSVEADPGQMQQILLNLAVNARDAMPDGGALRIATRNVRLDERGEWRRQLELEPGDYVELAVSDSGTGMDEAVQDRVFEPFFTTKEPGVGTGLGLSTVYGIVRQSGGGITVSSDEGRGTTFRVYLRRVEAPPPQISPAPEHGQWEEGSETILLVEDDDVVRSLTTRILEGRGYRVLPAGTPDEALRLCAENETVHLLLTDVVLPGMSGLQLIARLAEIRPEIRSLAMSGYRHRTSAEDRGLGTDIPFLAKPFGPAALARKVREVLDAQ